MTPTHVIATIPLPYFNSEMSGQQLEVLDSYRTSLGLCVRCATPNNVWSKWVVLHSGEWRAE